LIVELVDICWDYDPRVRPLIGTVNKILKGVCTNSEILLYDRAYAVDILEEEKEREKKSFGSNSDRGQYSRQPSLNRNMSLSSGSFDGMNKSIDLHDQHGRGISQRLGVLSDLDPDVAALAVALPPDYINGPIEPLISAPS
jgi:hypothetical protein